MKIIHAYIPWSFFLESCETVDIKDTHYGVTFIAKVKTNPVYQY